jgi:hypothetical protein
MAQAQVITAAGDTALGQAILRRVRIGGTVATVGAIQIKRGGTVIETIPAATNPGVERVYDGALFSAAQPLTINLASAGDAAIVITD